MRSSPKLCFARPPSKQELRRRVRAQAGAWARGKTLGRIAVVHLSLIGGMGLVVFTGANRNFFGVFIFLKALLNLASCLPQWNPKAPPA